jgi:diaminohydroxyphosphoribosylaminopyrimidine deaminase/5-amino-6-(5-phosphoribosylamino)uracil reductase
LVKGNGIKKLKQNNIEVITGVLENKCKLLNEDFFYYITEKKCFVTVKTALTLDGKTASVTGNSKWITNEKARRFGHYLRKINSCVLIGTNTLKTDNPNLNIRLYKNKYKHNTNIAVLDKNLCFNTKLNVFKNNPAENIFVFTASQNKQKINKLKKNGVNIIKTKLDKQGLINIKQVLKFLYKQGFLSVMVEGGSTLNYNLFKNKLVNKIHYIFAPKILGNGIPAVNGKLSDTIKNSIQIKNVSIKKIDDNFMVTGYCI